MRGGFVGVIGRPNVGKSTLVNYFVGASVAIATPMPQTTRQRIIGVRTTPEAQVVFVDTPGLHDPKHALGKYMVNTAQAAVDSSDILLMLVDARRGYTPEDRRIVELVARSKQPAILALNKVDLVKPKQRVLPLLDDAQRWTCFAEVIPVSAQTGTQMDTLLHCLIDRLPTIDHLWYDTNQLTDRPIDFRIAEIIREHVIRHTFEEVPHAVAVHVDQMQEDDPDHTQIHATIVVERAGQKSILIGKGGQSLKTIGTQARLAIQELLGRRVRLELWVKVTADWRQNAHKLMEFGYGGT